ncbi:MAG: AI-2E family transporter [Candidatus Doudnabacteria bacterium]|nr:AI-2E family transporter [Candidatus Doudnabacteria bacterium]
MDDKSHTTVDVSMMTILKVLFVLLLIWFLWAIKEIVLLFLISIIIASAIDPVADFLYRKRVPRALSVLLVYAVFFGLLSVIVLLLVPPITEQFKAISQADFYDKFTSRIGLYRDDLTRIGVGQAIENSIKNFAGNFAGALFQTTKGVITGFISVITVLAVSFYLTVEENGMKNLIRHLTPYKHQVYAMKLVNKIQKKIGAWVLGQLVLSAIIFGLTFIGLTLLKVEFALVLAVIAGILEIIPYIGPIVSVIPAVFFAFLQSPVLALAVLVLYIIIQQLENHILVPVVMSKSVGLNPVLVILGILVGGTLGGVVGAIIAVPILSGISVFVWDMVEGEELGQS